MMIINLIRKKVLAGEKQLYLKNQIREITHVLTLLSNLLIPLLGPKLPKVER